MIDVSSLLSILLLYNFDEEKQFSVKVNIMPSLSPSLSLLLNPHPHFHTLKMKVLLQAIFKLYWL